MTWNNDKEAMMEKINSGEAERLINLKRKLRADLIAKGVPGQKAEEFIDGELW